jgi:hypothetical protein
MAERKEPMNDDRQPALSRLLDPETSREAAAVVDVNAGEQAILASLRTQGPATALELAHRLQTPQVSVSPRMRPMADRNLVHDNGERRQGIVWAAGPAPTTGGPAKVPYRYYTRRNVRKLVIAAVKIRDYLEAKPQLTLEESVILNDALNPALAAVGQPSERETKDK